MSDWSERPIEEPMSDPKHCLDRAAYYALLAQSARSEEMRSALEALSRAFSNRATTKTAYDQH